MNLFATCGVICAIVGPFIVAPWGGSLFGVWGFILGIPAGIVGGLLVGPLLAMLGFGFMIGVAMLATIIERITVGSTDSE